MRLPTLFALALLGGFSIALTLLGVYLAGVKAYDEESDVLKARDKPLFAFLIDFSYKRRIFEVLLDVCLIMLAYWTAYAIKFEAFSQSPAWRPASVIRTHGRRGRGDRQQGRVALPPRR